MSSLLEQCTFKNTKWFSLRYLQTQCKVVDVYDADTITIILSIHNTFYKMKCRLYGIDSAEKRTKNFREKNASNESTNWLKYLILDKIVWIDCGKMDKYGRLLGNIYLEEEDLKNKNNSVNQQLINKGFAYKYDGKKKKDFNDWYKNDKYNKDDNHIKKDNNDK